MVGGGVGGSGFRPQTNIEEIVGLHCTLYSRPSNLSIANKDIRECGSNQGQPYGLQAQGGWGTGIGKGNPCGENESFEKNVMNSREDGNSDFMLSQFI